VLFYSCIVRIKDLGNVISKILSITDRRSKQNLTLIGVIRQLRDCNENLITSYKSYKEILSFAE
jgi:hypothetical protein